MLGSFPFCKVLGCQDPLFICGMFEPQVTPDDTGIVPPPVITSGGGFTVSYLGDPGLYQVQLLQPAGRLLARNVDTQCQIDQIITWVDAKFVSGPGQDGKTFKILVGSLDTAGEGDDDDEPSFGGIDAFSQGNLSLSVSFWFLFDNAIPATIQTVPGY